MLAAALGIARTKDEDEVKIGVDPMKDRKPLFCILSIWWLTAGHYKDFTMSHVAAMEEGRGR